MRKSVKVNGFHAFCMMERIMCNLLMKSALAYRVLTEYEYTLVCGRKGVLTHVTILFPVNAYHHLAGFQYARLAALSDRKTALDTILTEKVTHSQLASSGFQHNDRLECIERLQTHLENNQFVFRYRGHEPSFSKVRADYLMQMEDITFFTSDNVPVSIFKNTETDYQSGCPQLTVLQIRRKHLKTGEETVTYQRKGYSE